MASGGNPSPVKVGERVIKLNGHLSTGETLDAKEFRGEWVSWLCRDFIDNDDVLLEVGIFDESNDAGFILFDGGSTGTFVEYRRRGLVRVWTWSDYAFVIKPDGTGKYYDFRGVDGGVAVAPKDVFKCKRR